MTPPGISADSRDDADHNLYQLPFDQFQRYKGVQEIINRVRNKPRLRLLDVGGAPGHMVDFLPDDSIVLLDSQRAISRGLDRTKGSGAALPFRDEAFDAAITIDVFEHIPPNLREAFVEELLRVSQEFVIVAAPFQRENVRQAEHILYEYVLKELNVAHEFLIEHLEYGLPDPDDFARLLARKGMAFTSVPNGYLYHWLVMMGVNHYIQSIPGTEMLYQMVNRFYNEQFYEADRRMPCYRRIFVISKKEDSAIKAVEAYAQELETAGTAFDPAELEVLRVGIELFHAKKIRELEEHLRRQELIIREQEATLQSIFQSVSWRLILKIDQIARILIPSERLRYRIRDTLRRR